MSETDCPACGTTMICTPEGNCWCMALPARLAVPKDGGVHCLCPDCMQRASEALKLSEPSSKGKRLFF